MLTIIQKSTGIIPCQIEPSGYMNKKREAGIPTPKAPTACGHPDRAFTCSDSFRASANRVEAISEFTSSMSVPFIVSNTLATTFQSNKSLLKIKLISPGITDMLSPWPNHQTHQVLAEPSAMP